MECLDWDILPRLCPGMQPMVTWCSTQWLTTARPQVQAMLQLWLPKKIQKHYVLVRFKTKLLEYILLHKSSFITMSLHPSQISHGK